MSWSVYLYLPTDGVTSAAVASNSVYTTYVTPQGNSTPCYSNTALEDGERFIVILGVADGYQFTRWVLNEDGAVSYPTGDDLGNGSYALPYDHTGASKVYIRAEVSVAATYSATLAFDANGGTGAPGAVTGTNTGSSTVTLTIPGTIPTRTGYTFGGWLLTFSSGSSTYQPGGTASLEGTTSGIVYTAYAIWTKVETGGGVRIYASGWQSATAYIYTGSGWSKATPYVYTDNGWKKGT